ncbi:MAG: hypothetical protein WA921_11230 [Ahrensia sp.]
MVEHSQAELEQLIENEKRLAALEVHTEAWNDGLLEGIDASIMADTAIATALQETIALVGEDEALAMLDALRERLAAGEFSKNRVLQ